MTRESSHETIFELLPWYANRTLGQEECVAVEEHLSGCAECRQELEELGALTVAFKDFDKDMPPADVSFDRTMAAVGEWERERAESRPRLFSWLSAFWAPSIPVTRFVLAAQLALLLILAGLYWRTTWTGPYTTLSGQTGVRSGPRLTVMFQPTVTEQALRQVLVDLGANLVSGPSALGVYVVELTGRADSDAEVESTIRDLRAKTDVISFVERQP
ncbi:MAG TPA: zf-HC2 domain-containing protein [Terriglobia bacterium]|nr:zf-HC2 domain-containing protein [Terriglobia bacterium]